MIDVAVDALVHGRERPTRTRLITGLNLTWAKGKQMVDVLLRNGLLSEVDTGSYNVTVYCTTARGEELIRGYEKVTRAVGYRVIDSRLLLLKDGSSSSAL